MAQAGRGVGVVAERLAARREEIEQTILVRVYSVSDSTEAGDPEYALGLKAAVRAAVSYGLSAIEPPPGRDPPIPPELPSQARRAARSGVGLDTVLRRYFAGYTLVGDLIIEEAKRTDPLGDAELQYVLRGEAAAFDRLVVAVTDEYTREAERGLRSAEQRRAERVKQLLAGDLVDAGELGYDLEGWHLGLIARGIGAERAIRESAKTLGRRLLAVPGGEGILWAWLGGVSEPGPTEIEQLVAMPRSERVHVALGEPAHGMSGWRLTHRQAADAFSIVLRGPRSRVRYRDVALLASMLQDEVLVSSLSDLYLAPLMDEHGVLRRTLRAYFAAERHVSSTAAAMGVSRQTIAKRLRVVEGRLGKSLGACAAELEAALRLEGLDVLRSS